MAPSQDVFTSISKFQSSMYISVAFQLSIGCFSSGDLFWHFWYWYWSSGWDLFFSKCHYCYFGSLPTALVITCIILCSDAIPVCFHTHSPCLLCILIPLPYPNHNSLTCLTPALHPPTIQTSATLPVNFPPILTLLHPKHYNLSLLYL